MSIYRTITKSLIVIAVALMASIGSKSCPGIKDPNRRPHLDTQCSIRRALDCHGPGIF